MSDGIKQVIVIRKDLKMRRGKEIAQGAHASIAWLTSRMTMLGYVNPGETGKYANCHLTEPEWRWIEGNFRKVCCVVQSEQELLDLAAKAKEAQLVCEVIEDTGLTEFGGVPTLTALAIGPDYDEKIDPVTGDLKLYLRRGDEEPPQPAGRRVRVPPRPAVGDRARGEVRRERFWLLVPVPASIAGGGDLPRLARMTESSPSPAYGASLLMR